MLSLYCLAVLTHLAGTAMNLKRKLLTLSVALIPNRTAMSGNATMYRQKFAAMAVISRNTVFWFMNDFGRCAHPKS